MAFRLSTLVNGDSHFSYSNYHSSGNWNYNCNLIKLGIEAGEVMKTQTLVAISRDEAMKLLE